MEQAKGAGGAEQPRSVRDGATAPIDSGLIRDSMQRWDRALDATLRSSVVPYGYTVTIWASGAYLINLRGTPNLLEAFGYVAGAMLAFALLAAISSRLPHGRGIASAQHRPDPRHPLFAAGLHVGAVGLALGSAALVDLALGNWAWLFSSFAATAFYLSAAGAELAIAVELQRRQLRGEARRRRIGFVRRRETRELIGQAEQQR